MTIYAYRARDAGGQAVEGNLEAADDRDAVRIVQQRGLVLTRLTPVAAAPAGAAQAARPRKAGQAFGGGLMLMGGNVKLKSLSLLCRQLATMIGAGLSIVMSLDIVSDQTDDKSLAAVLKSVVERLEGGESIAESFAHHVPKIPGLMVHMIEAGEVGGVLDEVFVRLADHFERDHALAEKVKGALVYPKVVMTAAMCMVAFLVVTVLPTFAGLFASLGVKMPGLTRAVISFGDWARANIYALTAVAVALYAVITLGPRTQWARPYMDALVLRVPGLGSLYLKRAMARFTRTVATLLESGVPILTALQVGERTLENAVLERAVAKARENVRAGRTLAGPLREDKHFPRMLVEMAAVGEQTGALDTMLYQAADFYERETANTVERLTALLEPLMVVGTALVVGIIIASVFLPLYQVLGALE